MLLRHLDRPDCSAGISYGILQNIYSIPQNIYGIPGNSGTVFFGLSGLPLTVPPEPFTESEDIFRKNLYIFF